jgi:hypothetical protein
MTRPRIYPETIRAIDGNYFLSADYILRTGDCHGDRDPQSPNFFLDLNRPSELTRQLDDVYRRVMERLRDPSSTAQNLLRLPTWDRRTREMWEAELAQIIGHEFQQTPLFREYRPDGTRLPGNPYRSLNDLTETSRFVCHEMAVLHTLMQQRVENEFLPADGDSV